MADDDPLVTVRVRLSTLYAAKDALDVGAAEVELARALREAALRALTPEEIRDWEPNYGFCATRDSDPLILASALEYVRRRTCAYGPNARRCDCKQGAGKALTKGGSPDSEQTGCTELREVIHKLLHRAGPLNPSREEYLERELADERRSGGEVAEALLKRIRELSKSRAVG